MDNKDLTSFDKAAKEWTSSLFVDENVIPFTFLKKIQSKIILEAGCGEGYLCRYLVKTGNNIVYGIDNSKVLLKQAKEEEDINPQGIIYEFGDVRKLPYADNFFDVVYSGGVIEHFDGTEIAVAEMLRVLKKDGTVIIGVPNSLSFYRVASKVLQFFNLYGPGYEKGYVPKWIINELNKSGCYEYEIIFIWKPQNISRLGIAKKSVLCVIAMLDYIPYKLGFGGFFFYIIAKKK